VVWARSVTPGETSGAAEATEGGTSPERWNLSFSLELEANVTFLTGIMKSIHTLNKEATPN
jgi:hypothetical protein